MLGRGTGTLPYLDFIYFIIRYIYWKIPKDNFQFNQNRIDNENFDSIGKNFKLIFFASYYNENSAVLHNFLTDADRIDKKYKLGLFDYYYNFEKKVTKNKWNSQFYDEIITPHYTQIKNIYLCGTNLFMEYSKEELIKTSKLLENKFIYL